MIVLILSIGVTAKKLSIIPAPTPDRKSCAKSKDSKENQILSIYNREERCIILYYLLIVSFPLGPRNISLHHAFANSKKIIFRSREIPIILNRISYLQNVFLLLEQKIIK